MEAFYKAQKIFDSQLDSEIRKELNLIIPPWSSSGAPSFQKTHQRIPVSNWNCCSHVPKKKTLTAAQQKKNLYPAMWFAHILIPAHVNIEGNECADSLAKEARDIEHKCTTITLDDANAVAKHRIKNHTLKTPSYGI
ncbi:hypothetical protein TNCV_1983801 [Trichonephila clavipes]|nr:hypothetical protein TNCV_1983801 [Trichonephila clavipes]